MLQRDNVTDVVEQYSLTWQSVTTATPYFLIVILDALRQIIVHHKAHIALVDAHSEGNRGTDHLNAVVDEIFLHPATFSRW